MSLFSQGTLNSRSVIVPLSRRTGDTSALVSAARAGLRAIYQTGFMFAKAGVTLMDIQPASRQQFELDPGEREPERDRSRLMVAMDAVNDRWGRGSVKVGSARIGEVSRDWGMRQEREAPGYTTEWNDMPTAKT